MQRHVDSRRSSEGEDAEVDGVERMAKPATPHRMHRVQAERGEPLTTGGTSHPKGGAIFFLVFCCLIVFERFLCFSF